jgi:hypothetical protein
VTVCIKYLTNTEIIKNIYNQENILMRKLLVLAVIASFVLGTNGFAASNITVKEEKLVNVIQKAAMNDEWTQYTPSTKCASETLYFKKRIKNKDYYTYRYQNRHRNKRMTVYVKVDYADTNVDVEFVDKVRMNPGSIGIDNKLDKVLHEFKDAIDLELSTQA